MIFGIGLDLIEIGRVERLLERSGPPFLERILHPREFSDRLDKRDGPAHIAGLFAAKEAVMKALGTGMAGAAFAEIEIRHTQAGQPRVELHGETREAAVAAGVASFHLSITHNKTTAAAVAVALGDPK